MALSMMEIQYSIILSLVLFYFDKTSNTDCDAHSWGLGKHVWYLLACRQYFLISSLRCKICWSYYFDKLTEKVFHIEGLWDSIWSRGGLLLIDLTLNCMIDNTLWKYWNVSIILRILRTCNGVIITNARLTSTGE